MKVLTQSKAHLKICMTRSSHYFLILRLWRDLIKAGNKCVSLWLKDAVQGDSTRLGQIPKLILRLGAIYIFFKLRALTKPEIDRKFAKNSQKIPLTQLSFGILQDLSHIPKFILG